MIEDFDNSLLRQVQISPTRISLGPTQAGLLRFRLAAVKSTDWIGKRTERFLSSNRTIRKSLRATIRRGIGNEKACPFAPHKHFADVSANCPLDDRVAYDIASRVTN